MYKLSHIKDVLGNNYLGIKFDESQIETHLLDLMDHVGSEQFDVLTNNQKNRDGNSYHMTLINVMEYNSSIKKFGIGLFVEKLNGSFSLNIDDLEMLGLGSAEKNGNISYFIVIKSTLLNEIRNSFGLGERDLHITIGFDKKDVFGVRKNEDTLI